MLETQLCGLHFPGRHYLTPDRQVLSRSAPCASARIELSSCFWESCCIPLAVWLVQPPVASHCGPVGAVNEHGGEGEVSKSLTGDDNLTCLFGLSLPLGLVLHYTPAFMSQTQSNKTFPFIAHFKCVKCLFGDMHVLSLCQHGIMWPYAMKTEWLTPFFVHCNVFVFSVPIYSNIQNRKLL